MSIFKIAWRSIQHRGLGSLLTIISMALGVMLVVSVLSIHGLISDSFRSNSSFGYDILVGARGGGLQLTMNTVYYLSQPVENVPYEYYLAFCDEEKRNTDLQRSFSFEAFQHEMDSLELCSVTGGGCGGLPARLSEEIVEASFESRQLHQSQIERGGIYKPYTAMAIPLCLGDTFEVNGHGEEGAYFRCVGTTPEFFTELVLDVDTEEKFKFEEGRAFVEFNEENGYYECVIGALVAKNSDKKIGDLIYPTHGDPNDDSAHIHERGFIIVGILEGTRTPHDRAVFLNMEGFYLMEGHDKPIDEGPPTVDEDEEDSEPAEVDEFDMDDEDDEADNGEAVGQTWTRGLTSVANQAAESTEEPNGSTEAKVWPRRLAIEQREVTSILIRTEDPDGYGALGYILPAKINDGSLERTLGWSAFRPVRAQKAAQAVNPIGEITNFFATFIAPIQWLLLALTTMICIVSGISIIVGIYNSMNQRRHEIAVMRALGANRFKVMAIMLVEAFLLAFAGGVLGWISGHLLNLAISPAVEAKTGVGIGFFDFAPGIKLFGLLEGLLGGSTWPDWLVDLTVSPEFLLIPGLILLAMLVGIYPAISAYRTDVAKALGK